ncbi:hypothetical protein [Sulfurimonas sp.]|uniref:hypothetical protein n=1 Tax=Sulfurimonas sp. TaxID=2022749 RepID=UPI003D0FFDDC
MDINNTNEIPLHDIKPLMEVQEYSFYYFLAIVIAVTVIVIGVLYLLYRYFKERKRYNKRKDYLARLKDLDMHDTKQSAYDLTMYGAVFKDDTPRHLKHYELMVEKLQAYKYKKSVEAFDADTLRQIDVYKGILDV